MKKIYPLLILCLTSTFATNAQPCTGTPVAGTITMFPASSCASSIQPAYLVLSGHSTGPGIQWYWEESPCGSMMWLPLLPPNTDTLVLNPLTMSWNCVDYRIVIHCSNSNLTDISPIINYPGIPPAGCQDSVWPGDVNYDYITNNLDALDLATVIGSTGTPRQNPSIAYAPQFSFDWGTTFPNNRDIKNGDCDGNGLIDINDTLAIFNNYGLPHLKGTPTPKAKITAFPDLYFDPSGITFTPGSTVSVPIKLGTAAMPMNSFYGLAATIMIDPIALSDTAYLTYPSSWLGTSTNTLRFSKPINQNRIDWTYARTDQQNTSGDGTLAHLNFTIPATATGNLTLTLSDVKMIDKDGTEITDYNVLNDTVSITPNSIEYTNRSNSTFTISPNPSGTLAKLTFSLERATHLNIRILDTRGSLIWESSQYHESGLQHLRLPDADVPPGLYLVRISSGSQQSTLKWMKY